jgi:hypothetical protein
MWKTIGLKVRREGEVMSWLRQHVAQKVFVGGVSGFLQVGVGREVGRLTCLVAG